MRLCFPEGEKGRYLLNAVFVRQPSVRVHVDLTNRARGSSICAARSNVGAMLRQGPQHGVQKSTISGTSEFARCLWNGGPSSSIGPPENSF